MQTPDVHLHFNLDMKDSCNDCKSNCCINRSTLHDSDESVELYVKKDGRIVRLKKHDDALIARSHERFDKLLREKADQLPMDTDVVVTRIKENADIDPRKPITLEKVKKISSSLDDMMKLNRADT